MLSISDGEPFLWSCMDIVLSPQLPIFKPPLPTNRQPLSPYSLNVFCYCTCIFSRI